MQVKVDYEMVVPDGGKYPEPEWYVWIDLDGTGVKRVRVPPEKIVDDYAPTGQAYAFRARTHHSVLRPAAAADLEREDFSLKRHPTPA